MILCIGITTMYFTFIYYIYFFFRESGRLRNGIYGIRVRECVHGLNAVGIHKIYRLQ